MVKCYEGSLEENHSTYQLHDCSITKKTNVAIPVEEGKGLFDSMQFWYYVFGTLEMGMGDNESE